MDSSKIICFINSLHANISYFRSRRSQMFFKVLRYLLGKSIFAMMWLFPYLITSSIILKYFDIFSIIPDTVGTVFKYTLNPT